MSLPYENATSGNNAMVEIRKMLQAFGCTKFASGEDFDTGELFVQFEHRARMVNLRASSKGYAAAWLKEHPHGPRTRGTRAQHEAKALQIGSVAVYSILRDWVKGQLTAVEIGMMSFDAAFLSHILLPSGMSVIEHIEAQKMLPRRRVTVMADHRTSISGATAAAIAEVQRAMQKFPTWPTDPLHALAVLGEEFGELTKAVLQSVYEPHKVQPGDVRSEAVQTAAMAIRFLASLDRYEFVVSDQHEQTPLSAEVDL